MHQLNKPKIYLLYLHLHDLIKNAFVEKKKFPRKMMRDEEKPKGDIKL